MDVKNAFINSDMSEEFCIRPPPGLSHYPNKVYCFRRDLYGLSKLLEVGLLSLALVSLVLDTPSTPIT
jgi:hypothetical protein